MTLKRLTIPLIAAALILGACEAEEEPAVEAAAAGEESSRDDPAARGSTRGELMPINRSEVRGRAEVVRDGDQLVVEVEAQGLEPIARYAAFLHEGRCAEGGPVRLPLGWILAGEDGAGSARQTVEAEQALAGPDLFIQLHAPDDQPVACADVGPGEPGP